MNEPIALPLDQAELEAELHAGSLLRRTVLPSGLRVLTERVPGSSSVAIGLWVPVGSRDEASHQYGSTHFLEHLLFKGTQTRSAYDIAIAFDRVGGESNAATAREHTVYHAKVRDADLSMAIDVLADMITGSVIDPTEFEIERGVILEELAMADDDPTDVLWERFYEAVLTESTLGRPIGGTPESIRAATRDDVWQHYRANYRPESLVVTIAGAVDHDDALRQITDALMRGGWKLDDTSTPVARRSREHPELPPMPETVRIDRQLEQVNMLIGARGLTSTDPDRQAFALAHRAFGGGMSSRLFQEVREKRGMAYSVHSFAAGHSDLGISGMYAGCSPERAGEVADLMRAELDRLLQDGITEEELADAKGAAAGASALALEDVETRMSRLGAAELHRGEFIDLEAALKQIDAVTVDDCTRVMRRVFAGALNTTLIGPGGGTDSQARMGNES